MIGSLIGAGASLAGNVLGGIMGSKSAKRYRKMLAEQKKKNEEWYNRRYNEVGTERADAQAALTRMREVMAERRKASSGAQAVMGSGAERVAVEKDAQNKALANTISAINAQQEARKDAIEAQYQSRAAQLAQQEMELEQGRAEGIAQATSGMLGAAGDIAGSFFDESPKKSK